MDFSSRRSLCHHQTRVVCDMESQLTTSNSGRWSMMEVLRVSLRPSLFHLHPLARAGYRVPPVGRCPHWQASTSTH